jgi:hypothetical protein
MAMINGKPVMANPGAVGMSFADCKDKYEFVARAEKMVQKILHIETTDEGIMYSLGKFDLPQTAEAAQKVRAYLNSFA